MKNKFIFFFLSCDHKSKDSKERTTEEEIKEGKIEKDIVSNTNPSINPNKDFNNFYELKEKICKVLKDEEQNNESMKTFFDDIDTVYQLFNSFGEIGENKFSIDFNFSIVGNKKEAKDNILSEYDKEKANHFFYVFFCQEESQLLAIFIQKKEKEPQSRFYHCNPKSNIYYGSRVMLKKEIPEEISWFDKDDKINKLSELWSK